MIARSQPPIALALLAVLSLGATFLGAATEEFQWQGYLEPGRSLEIKGINGKVSAHPARGREVGIVAVKKGKRRDLGEVKIQVVEHEGGITICAVYPGSGTPKECRPGESGPMKVRRNDVQVHFQALVPEGVHLVVRTVNGNISTDRLGGDVWAHTVNGDVNISSRGTATAKTVNGMISAAFGSNLAGDSLFETVNGSIVVEVPSNAAADVWAHCANGSITTDFPLEVHGQWGPKELRGELGGGGPQLTLKTVNGNLKLRRAAQ